MSSSRIGIAAMKKTLSTIIFRILLVSVVALGLEKSPQTIFAAAQFPYKGTYNHHSMITIPDGEACDNAGYFVMNDRFLATGKMYEASCPERDMSAVYIYEKTSTGWVHSWLLMPPNEQWSNRKASPTAIDNDRLVVTYSDLNTSSYLASAIVAIFHFDGTNWIFDDQLIAPDPTNDLGFGSPIILSGSKLLIGATRATIDGRSYKGAVFNYEFSSDAWVLTQKITDTADIRSNYFGTPIVLQDDTLFIGFPNFYDGGKVNTYKWLNGTWTASQVITSPNATYNAYFGDTIAVDGNTLVIGATWDDIGTGLNQGSAFIFEKEGDLWVEKGKLTASSPQQNDYFGSDVEIAGATIYVGSSQRSTDGNSSGAVSIYHKPATGWQAVQPAQELRYPNSGYFGGKIQAIGNSLYIASPYQDVNGNANQGAIHVYHLGISHTQLYSIFEGEENLPLSFRLDSPPAYPATISIHSNDPSVVVFPSQLVFNPDNWDQVQDFLITSIGNCQVEGPRLLTLSFTVLSQDYFYNNLTISPITVGVDEKFFLMENEMFMEESGSQQNGIYLVSAPEHPVTFSAQDNPALLMSPNPLIVQQDEQISFFDVQAVDNNVFLGNQNLVFTLQSSSADPFYDDISICLNVLVTENDYFAYLPIVGNHGP